MDKQSVEQLISLVPATLFTLLWDDHLSEKDRKLTIDPSQRLKANTTYTAVLDSGYQTVAGKTGNRYTFSFKTLPVTLVEYKPLNGQVNVPTSSLIELTFNTALDTTSLLPNITLTPAVDSLHIAASSVSNSAALYHLDHKGFLPETAYTLTLQNGIGDQFGVPLGKVYSISFTTGK